MSTVVADVQGTVAEVILNLQASTSTINATVTPVLQVIEATVTPMQGFPGIPGTASLLCRDRFLLTGPPPFMIQLSKLPRSDAAVIFFVNGVEQDDVSDLTGGGDTYTFSGPGWPLIAGDRIAVVYQH